MSAPQEESSLPPCPTCGLVVLTSRATGDQHPETYLLWPCGCRLTDPGVVDEYSMAICRSLGYAC